MQRPTSKKEFSLGTVVVVLAALVLASCSKHKAEEFHLQEIGRFTADSAQNRIDVVFQLPRGYEAACLGISVDASARYMAEQDVRFLDEMLGLRLRIRMSAIQQPVCFYEESVGLRGNSAYYPLWQPNYGCLIAGVQPLPYGFPSQDKAAATNGFFDRKASCLKAGRLKPGTPYRLEIGVVDPISLTNRVHVWLYSFPKPTGVSR